MFGGDSGVACQRLNDIWSATIEHQSSNVKSEIEWKKWKVSGVEPAPRSNCASVLKNSKIYVYGGWDMAGKHTAEVSSSSQEYRQSDCKKQDCVGHIHSIAFLQ